MSNIELPEKLLPLLNTSARYKIVYGGRGSSKSWSIARMLILLAASKPIRVLCARETQKSIQESVHRLLKDQIDLLGLSAFFEVQENKILGKNGSDFAFIGIRQQSVTNIKSFEGVDIVFVEEGQVVTKRSWDVLIPTIRKPGSEIWIAFNPELDSDETYERFVLNPPEGAMVVEMNYIDNPWFPPELEIERLAWQKRDPEGYKTVWEGKCRAAVEGAIYAQEIDACLREGRIRNVPVDNMLKTHTVWDLGWNDSMSIMLVQRSASEIRVIDYIEDSHRTLDSYVNQLKDMKLNWGTDYLPHDGRTKDFKSGKSTEEIMQAMGRTTFVLGRDDVESGIRQARMVFPRCYFDKDKTHKLINSLKRYRRTINLQTNEPGAPLHDEFSHGSDCFRYMTIAAEQMSNDEWGGTLNYPKLHYA